MITLKNKMFGMFAILLTVAVILGNCEGTDSHLHSHSGESIPKISDSTPKLSEIIEDGDLHNLTLTIYYMSFSASTRLPVSLDRLTSELYDYKVTVSGEQLEEHSDLLNQISKTVLLPAENESFVDARLYYVFEHEEYGEIFSFLIFTGYGTMYINGYEVEHNNIFYYAVIPFLPADAVEAIEMYLSSMEQS
jgi:hypothetical protein